MTQSGIISAGCFGESVPRSRRIICTFVHASDHGPGVGCYSKYFMRAYLWVFTGCTYIAQCRRQLPKKHRKDEKLPAGSCQLNGSSSNGWTSRFLPPTSALKIICNEPQTQQLGTGTQTGWEPRQGAEAGLRRPMWSSALRLMQMIHGA